MSAPTNCCSPCDSVETVNVPGIEGDPGTDGADGTDGVNAYTVTTDDGVNSPAVGDDATIEVAENSWMVIGQIIFIEGWGFYEVLSTSGTTNVTVENTGYEENAAPATPIATGAGVSPGGSQPDVSGFAESGANNDITSITGLITPLAVSQGGSGRAAPVVPLDVYASGTNAVVTNVAAALNFGTQDPSLTFATAGKYRVTARVRPYLNGVTFAAAETISWSIRQTSPGASTLPNSTTINQLGTGNLGTSRQGDIVLPPVIYDAAAADVITIFAVLSASLVAGTYEVVEADLHADPIPLY